VDSVGDEAAQFSGGRKPALCVGEWFSRPALYAARSHSFFCIAWPYLGAENTLLRISIRIVAGNGLKKLTASMELQKLKCSLTRQLVYFVFYFSKESSIWFWMQSIRLQFENSPEVSIFDMEG
jgi:hypothetical protein